MTDSKIGPGAFSVPAASLTCIETVFVVAAIALYNRAVALAARRMEAFTPLQLMGLGHGAVIAVMALAACAESRRLANVRTGAAPLGIAWLLLQYVVMAVSRRCSSDRDDRLRLLVAAAADAAHASLKKLAGNGEGDGPVLNHHRGIPHWPPRKRKPPWNTTQGVN